MICLALAHGWLAPSPAPDEQSAPRLHNQLRQSGARSEKIAPFFASAVGRKPTIERLNRDEVRFAFIHACLVTAQSTSPCLDLHPADPAVARRSPPRASARAFDAAVAARRIADDLVHSNVSNPNERARWTHRVQSKPSPLSWCQFDAEDGDTHPARFVVARSRAGDRWLDRNAELVIDPGLSPCHSRKIEQLACRSIPALKS